jgi:hypothetical protein
MLNEDFLYLMEAFLSDLNDSSHLISSIQLLKHTSRIISVFRDSRPVTSLSDCRIKILKDAFDWFQDWKKEIAQLKTTGVNTAKKLISPKCLEDIENGSRSNRPQTKSAQSQIGPKSNRPQVKSAPVKSAPFLLFTIVNMQS